MILRLYLKYKDGSQITINNNILNFTLLKDAYIPYSVMSAVFFKELENTENICEASLYMNGRIHHHGIVDTIRAENYAGKTRVSVTSRGFTSLLTENQLEPGMYNNISIDGLFSDHIQLPHVLHENDQRLSYIFVKQGTPMWDGVVNLSYKLTGNYPYIRDNNTVMMNMPSNPRNITYDPETVIRYGSELDTRHVVSHYHMADISGAYGTFDYTDTDAVSRNIIRHHRFELDKRFLQSPYDACNFRGAVSLKNVKRDFIVYSGFKFEDINDIATYEDIIVSQRVKRIKVTGGIKGITTEVSFYTDSFNPSSEF